MEHEDDKTTAMTVQPIPTGRQTAMTTAFQGLIPTSIGEAYTLANYLAKSQAIPKFYRGKPDTVLTVILAGLEVGLTPIRSLNNLTNISGNLGMKADLQLALVRRSGLLGYYDEGFEVRGETDTDLATRTQDGPKILALVKTIPGGKPYGWATAGRKGAGEHLTTRTFTWIDAETAEIWEREDDGDGGGGRKKSKLSAKFNYVAFPGDMYPKRARGRVLQITHSDVLAGMLSTEAMEGGQVPVIDVESEPADTPDDLLGAMTDGQRDAVSAGFDFLKFSSARRLQKLVEYRGRADDLATWLRDEAGQRTGKGKVGTDRKAKAAADKVIDVTPEPKPEPDPQPEPKAATEPSAADSLVAALDSKFAAQAQSAEPAVVNSAETVPGPAPSRAKLAAAAFRDRFGNNSPSF